LKLFPDWIGFVIIDTDLLMVAILFASAGIEHAILVILPVVLTDLAILFVSAGIEHAILVILPAVFALKTFKLQSTVSGIMCFNCVLK